MLDRNHQALLDRFTNSNDPYIRPSELTTNTDISQSTERTTYSDTIPGLPTLGVSYEEMNEIHKNFIKNFNDKKTTSTQNNQSNGFVALESIQKELLTEFNASNTNTQVNTGNGTCILTTQQTLETKTIRMEEAF